MTQGEQNRILDLLQSIVSSAIGAQTNLDHGRKLGLLAELLEDIKSDCSKAERIVDEYREPERHQFVASRGFSGTCSFCGESEPLHEVAHQ